MTSHVPLTVTARMAQALATAHPWGIALDGLLASQIWADTIAHNDPDTLPWPSQTDEPPDLPLPLARCTMAGGQWHWAATCSWAPDPHRASAWYSAYADQRALADLTTALPGTMPTGYGRYADRRRPAILTVTDTLIWRAVGDPDHIRDLLTPLTAIGKHRGHGEGHVLHWQITPNPDADPWEHAHLHPNGHLGRTCPPGCLTDHLKTSPPIMAGLRPPYMHPSRQHLLHAPTDEEATQ